jgi:hypothetical protein
MSSHSPEHLNSQRPKRLLSQNSRLRPIGVWAWTLPAWAGRLPDGRTYNTCPSAGICRDVCYARSARSFICCKVVLLISWGSAASLRIEAA